MVILIQPMVVFALRFEQRTRLGEGSFGLFKPRVKLQRQYLVS